jgi:predicted nuclease with RNAse H fold/dephospho-CoA kinase
MFLDIETTGLSRHYDYITLVGYEVDGEYNVLLAGEDESHFRLALERATSLVTFNGSGFDLPFLASAFKDLRWPRHHVDLRYACRRVGLTGGQKAIEEELRITCRQGFEGVDGAMAVVLWHRYLRGDIGALRELIEYNRADVRAMAYILDHVVAKAAPVDLLTRTTELYRFCSTPDFRRGIAVRSAALPPPPTHMRKPVTFERLFSRTAAENATVVGLDLTGSAARPSGVCVMRGRLAETRTMSEDADILDAVLEAAPDIVSIDSPLCLPVGRTRVTDDDPTRKEAGIMRISERILKRRGINVYPCLLPSMQRLTERGIRLAAALRGHGVHVIECYPGAAQDIMGIPRKGAGEEWLRLGLSDFGVLGAYTADRVTHDELDAITCSVVGFFHLAGLTEGIGGEGEEPMIIPDLHAGKGIVVGISGEMFAGKTTAARFLESEGFAYTRISEVIDEVLEKRGELLTRENRQRLGKELHEAGEQRWLCRRAIERIAGTPKDIVVDGLRWPEDVAYLAERFGGRFRHLHISAPEHVRRQRADRLGRADEFDEAVQHPVESGVADLEASAEVCIINDCEVSALGAELRERVIPKEGTLDAN